jgi:hypothetical protein
MAISKYEFYLRMDNEVVIKPDGTYTPIADQVPAADLVLPTRAFQEFDADGNQAVRQMTKAEFTAWVATQPDDFTDENMHGAKSCSILGTVFHPLGHERIGEYPDTKDQLDGIYKALKEISASGVSLGSDADAYIASIDKVKTDFPKA